MTAAIALFVKTPGLSPVKTRLAVSLGQQTAETFHLAAAQSVAETISAASELQNIQGYYAVAEYAAQNHPYWQDLPCIWQGEGGLGERMASIYKQLLTKHEYVILVGADIPQMTVTHLLAACAWLDKNNELTRFALAPSDDGGFWLFGGNGPIPKKIWTDVVYSQEDTAAQFLPGIRAIGEIKFLSKLRDVDELEDLDFLYEALKNLNRPLCSQQKMIVFLESILHVKQVGQTQLNR